MPKGQSRQRHKKPGGAKKFKISQSISDERNHREYGAGQVELNARQIRNVWNCLVTGWSPWQAA